MCQGSLNGDFSKVNEHQESCENYEAKSLKYAEEHGIVEYEVNGYMMEFGKSSIAA